MLIDSGASWSFVSHSFSMEFAMPLGELECPLRVSIANEHTFSASSVYQVYVLEIFGVSYLINLTPNPMGDVGVIVSMD